MGWLLRKPKLKPNAEARPKSWDGIHPPAPRPKSPPRPKPTTPRLPDSGMYSLEPGFLAEMYPPKPQLPPNTLISESGKVREAPGHLAPITIDIKTIPTAVPLSDTIKAAMRTGALEESWRLGCRREVEEMDRALMALAKQIPQPLEETILDKGGPPASPPKPAMPPNISLYE